MRLHLGGHLSWYDPQKRSWLEVKLFEPTLLAAVLQNLGVPVAEIAVGAINGSTTTSIDNIRVTDTDQVELFPPVGGGQTESTIMSVFSAAEIAYMTSQRIGRVATVGPRNKPHVVPVGFRYNPESDCIEIGGRTGFTKRKHYRDMVRNPSVAFVIDDLPSVNPWTIRGIEIRGTAEVLTSGGEKIVPVYGPDMIRIHAKRIVSWGIESKDAPAAARTAKH